MSPVIGVKPLTPFARVWGSFCVETGTNWKTNETNAFCDPSSFFADAISCSIRANGAVLSDFEKVPAAEEWGATIGALL